MKTRATFIPPVVIDTEAINQATRLFNSALAWSGVDELLEGPMFR